MKKESRHRGPSKRSLREIPEVDLANYRVRKNPFARKAREDGIQIATPPPRGRVARGRAPSKASLREIPEVSATGAMRNPYSARVAQAGGVVLQVGRGRPKRGEEVGETIPKSVRFPVTTWRELEKRARKEGLSLHAALRLAILRWLKAS
jgi:hypothetical protein